MRLPVRHALHKLGHDIRDARRRRIPAAIAAQRASISRTTLVKIEKGDLAAPKNDPVGLQLEEENLPQRIRVSRSPKQLHSHWRWRWRNISNRALARPAKSPHTSVRAARQMIKPMSTISCIANCDLSISKTCGASLSP